MPLLLIRTEVERLLCQGINLQICFYRHKLEQGHFLVQTQEKVEFDSAVDRQWTTVNGSQSSKKNTDKNIKKLTTHIATGQYRATLAVTSFLQKAHSQQSISVLTRNGNFDDFSLTFSILFNTVTIFELFTQLRFGSEFKH